MIKRNCYELVFLDVSHKWLDNTKTTVELIFHDTFGVSTVLAYTHTDNDINTAKSKSDELIDLLLKTIKENIVVL